MGRHQGECVQKRVVERCHRFHQYGPGRRVTLGQRLDPSHDGPAPSSPFEGHRFEHPQTRWFNLNSLAGAARFFPSNAGRILDFFAAKVARNVAEGRRTLLVCRKRFVPLCRRLLCERLAALGVMRPHISHRFPMERAADAFRVLIDRKVVGKAVIEMTAR